MPFNEENPSVKPQKKKSYKKKATLAVQSPENGALVFQQSQGPPAKMVKKGLKRMAKTDVPPPLHQRERSASDSLADSSASGDEYRALRRQYLLMEEESFRLGNQLRELETEVMMLEDEKHELLDELVVFEGLVSPSELRNQGLL
ncbi:hypothetical protein MLD38_028734 [Melastoma candidum]|uniref:Uncharacterized protein n=1 Tax=Melastoma candidum TaxID=119954 RepID=A0ACB9N441_9MYRT|nr:hypothetical protein MLD38_028734 [Melastoma candidum]